MSYVDSDVRNSRGRSGGQRSGIQEKCQQMQVDGKVEEEQVNMEVRGEVRRSRQNMQIYIYSNIF